MFSSTDPARDLSQSSDPLPDLTAESGAVWERVRRRLRAELGEDVFNSWIKSMEIEQTINDLVRLSVPTRFLKSWIENHYRDRMVLRWSEEQGRPTRLEIVVRSAGVKAQPRPRPASDAIVRPLALVPRLTETAPAPVSVQEAALGGSPLDPRLTFDTFVQGRANSLARAAALQVSQTRANDAVLFNPFYIHAGVGLGKTHLLQAIAWAVQSQGNKRVLYLTAEKFMYGFVAALKSQTAIAFKDALRGIDLLIIDDLQFLQGKSTQAEFCHTLNALIDAGRQVVVAGDRPPSDLESLDDRVRSRLAGGLTVEIGALDEQLRLDILKQKLNHAKSQHQGFDVPSAVLGYVARNVTQNGRDLDGAFNRLLASNRLTGQPVTMEIAERSIRDLVRVAEPRRVKIEDIQRVVAKHFNVSRSDILSSRRTATVVHPRQIAMFLAKTMTLRSLPEIGRRFGGRDHTTVLHAVRKIENLLGIDNALNEEIELLKRMLSE